MDETMDETKNNDGKNTNNKHPNTKEDENLEYVVQFSYLSLESKLSFLI